MNQNILVRKRIVVNTDPQRRCYNGCHAKSELRWTEWEVLEFSVPEAKVDGKLTFWRELNDFAVSQRGESARSEFKAVPLNLDGPFILTYELQDDPGYEREEFVKDPEAARDHLRGKSDMIVWAELSDMDGSVVADTGDLI